MAGYASRKVCNNAGGLTVDHPGVTILIRLSGGKVTDGQCTVIMDSACKLLMLVDVHWIRKAREQDCRQMPCRSTEQPVPHALNHHLHDNPAAGTGTGWKHRNTSRVGIARLVSDLATAANVAETQARFLRRLGIAGA